MKTPKPPKPAKVDKTAPKTLTVTLPWGQVVGGLRVFTTGGVGYNFSGKVVNPKSGEVYNFSGNLVLVGSTPKKAKK